MNAEFNVWLLIVGLVVGAGLVWLVVMDARRRETEVDDTERPREARWLSAVLDEDGFDVTPEAAERLLILHRAYLEAPPPDPVVVADPTDAQGSAEAPVAVTVPGPPVDPQAPSGPAPVAVDGPSEVPGSASPDAAPVDTNTSGRRARP